MTLSNTQLAAQDYAVRDPSSSIALVEALERQLQAQPAIASEQVQACQLEPGDRVLYKDRLMRVGSIQPSTTRRWGFFVSLLPADYCNPNTDYKRWQAHLKQHRLEIPTNWFTPWQRVKPELETVELPHNPFQVEPQTSLELQKTQEASLATQHCIRVVQFAPTRFHCEDQQANQGCIIWIDRGEFHAPTVVWPELAQRAIQAVQTYLVENPLFLEYNRHQCCYCVYRNDDSGRYIGSTLGTSTLEVLLNTDRLMQKVRAGVLGF